MFLFSGILPSLSINTSTQGALFPKSVSLCLCLVLYVPFLSVPLSNYCSVIVVFFSLLLLYVHISLSTHHCISTMYPSISVYLTHACSDTYTSTHAHSHTRIKHAHTLPWPTDGPTTQALSPMTSLQVLPTKVPRRGIGIHGQVSQ